MEKFNQKESLQSDCRRFRKACEQIVLLNSKLDNTRVRYSKARKMNKRSAKYTLRMKIAVIENIRDAYYAYACQKADAIEVAKKEHFEVMGD